MLLRTVFLLILVGALAAAAGLRRAQREYQPVVQWLGQIVTDVTETEGFVATPSRQISEPESFMPIEDAPEMPNPQPAASATAPASVSSEASEEQSVLEKLRALLE